MEIYGAVEATVRNDIAGLGELTGIRPSLAQIAYALAAYLDGNPLMEPTSGKPARDQTATVAKELRACLEALTEGENDDIRTGQAAILKLLSAPVRHPSQPAPGDAGRTGGRGGDAAGDAADAVAAPPGRRSA